MLAVMLHLQLPEQTAASTMLSACHASVSSPQNAGFTSLATASQLSVLALCVHCSTEQPWRLP